VSRLRAVDCELGLWAAGWGDFVEGWGLSLILMD
jgi:hypothetical protein